MHELLSEEGLYSNNIELAAIHKKQKEKDERENKKLSKQKVQDDPYS